MANFLTQQQEVASRLRMDLTQAAQLTLIQRWLNRAQKEIWDAEEWNFALDRQIVQTVVDITAGTVSIGISGQAVTGVGTPWGSSQVNSYIQFSTSNDWYKITAVASATSLTIEQPYVGTTALSAGSYTIRKMFYSLGSTVEHILSCRQMITPAPVMLIDFRDFDIFRPYPTQTGNPLLMILFGQDSSNNLQAGLYPNPSQIENIEVRFKKKPVDLVSNTDTSLIPDKWNETVMIDGAIALGYDYVSFGNQGGTLNQALAMKKQFLEGIERMKENHRPDSGKHQVIQSRDMLSDVFGPRLPFKYGAE